MTADRPQGVPKFSLQSALWVGFGLAVLLLLALLGPVLAPFLLAGILAYILNPLVTRLCTKGMPQLAAVLLVMVVGITLLVLLILTLVPLIREETRQLIARLPDLLGLINDQIAPWLKEKFGIRLKVYLTPAALRELLSSNWDTVQGILGSLLGSAATSGQVLLQLVSTLLLTPVALFYLLRDWKSLLERIEHLIPRRWHAQSVSLAHEVDGVLAEFLRGQLLVMALLAVYYSVALTVVGSDFALPLGLVTGLLVFIPYLGFTTGFVLALLVALLQFQGWGPIIAVLAVYGIGQLLESFILTPYLVGDRIGLHPLAVIFALLAFGQLFGFFGVLLALPASAALLVGLRSLRETYLESRFYTGN
ncbi:MAG TPA: AI-2E family transporter [Rhodocyclaceae bacterium]|jgi:predicted PurR-regulated permease PerM